MVKDSPGLPVTAMVSLFVRIGTLGLGIHHTSIISPMFSIDEHLLSEPV